MTNTDPRPCGNLCPGVWPACVCGRMQAVKDEMYALIERLTAGRETPVGVCSRSVQPPASSASIQWWLEPGQGGLR